MIGMFDSGLGGLSVWRAVAAALPSHSIHYVADQIAAPYGQRSPAEIIDRSLKIGRFLQTSGAELLVVACNTATAVAVTRLRDELAIPVVGIEPAIKPAAQSSRARRIGVLATAVTLGSTRLQELVRHHAEGVDIVFQEGAGWVEQVEAGDLDSNLTRQLVTNAVTPLLSAGVDKIVLGCTHYPFVARLIRELVGQDIDLLDPADAVARRVSSLTTQSGGVNDVPEYRFMSTSAAPGAGQVLQRMLGQTFELSAIAV